METSLNVQATNEVRALMKCLGPVTQPKRKPGDRSLETVSKRKTKPSAQGSVMCEPTTDVGFFS